MTDESEIKNRNAETHQENIDMKNDSLYDDLPEEETADGSADESAEEDMVALDGTEETEEAEETRRI